MIPYDGKTGFYDRKENYAGHLLTKLTPRLLLELLDIEIRRNIHPNLWINSLFSNYKPYSKGKAHDNKDWSELYTHKECKNCKKEYTGWKRQYLCKECIEDNTIQFYPLWIITDLEHLNEFKAIKDRDSITILVERKPSFWKDDEWTDEMIDWHSSKDEFNYMIDNNCNIEDLVNKVREILIKENII